jgi:VPDSG-CTERM motif
MKITTNISVLLLAVSLTAAFQAHATTITNTISINNINQEILNNPYNGTFTDAALKGQNDTISDAIVYVTMQDAAGFPVILTIGGSKETNTFTLENQKLPYDLTSTQDTSIQNAFNTTGSISFELEADCFLKSVEFVFNTTPGTGQTQSVPDASSTVILLGGALSALGLLKRKLV